MRNRKTYHSIIFLCLIFLLYMSPTLKMSFKKSHIVIVKVQTFQKEAERENTHHNLKSPLVTTVKNSASSLTDFFLMHISSFHMDGII